jgi:hypothetical protein
VGSCLISTVSGRVRVCVLWVAWMPWRLLVAASYYFCNATRVQSFSDDDDSVQSISSATNNGFMRLPGGLSLRSRYIEVELRHFFTSPRCQNDLRLVVHVLVRWFSQYSTLNSLVPWWILVSIARVSSSLTVASLLL